MENGQIVNIPLTSELDVKSSDMLVSIHDPKFQHNRQRFQGHVLPTSLRYEKNGWAAGWDVYNFEFDEGTIYSSDGSMSLLRYKLNNNPAYKYVLRKRDTVKNLGYVYFNQAIDWGTVAYNNVGSGSGIASLTAQVTEDARVSEVTGEFSGKQFSFTADTSTIPATVTDTSSSGLSVELNSVSDKGVAELKITDVSVQMTVNEDSVYLPGGWYNYSTQYDKVYELAQATQVTFTDGVWDIAGVISYDGTDVTVTDGTDVSYEVQYDTNNKPYLLGVSYKKSSEYNIDVLFGYYTASHFNANTDISVQGYGDTLNGAWRGVTSNFVSTCNEVTHSISNIQTTSSALTAKLTTTVPVMNVFQIYNAKLFATGTTSTSTAYAFSTLQGSTYLGACPVIFYSATHAITTTSGPQMGESTSSTVSSKTGELSFAVAHLFSTKDVSLNMTKIPSSVSPSYTPDSLKVYANGNTVGYSTLNNKAILSDGCFVTISATESQILGNVTITDEYTIGLVDVYSSERWTAAASNFSAAVSGSTNSTMYIEVELHYTNGDIRYERLDVHQRGGFNFTTETATATVVSFTTSSSCTPQFLSTLVYDNSGTTTKAYDIQYSNCILPFENLSGNIDLADLDIKFGGTVVNKQTGNITTMPLTYKQSTSTDGGFNLYMLTKGYIESDISVSSAVYLDINSSNVDRYVTVSPSEDSLDSSKGCRLNYTGGDTVNKAGLNANIFKHAVRVSAVANDITASLHSVTRSGQTTMGFIFDVTDNLSLTVDLLYTGYDESGGLQPMIQGISLTPYTETTAGAGVVMTLDKTNLQSSGVHNYNYQEVAAGTRWLVIPDKIETVDTVDGETVVSSISDDSTAIPFDFNGTTYYGTAMSLTNVVVSFTPDVYVFLRQDTSTASITGLGKPLCDFDATVMTVMSDGISVKLYNSLDSSTGTRLALCEGYLLTGIDNTYIGEFEYTCDGVKSSTGTVEASLTYTSNSTLPGYTVTSELDTTASDNFMHVKMTVPLDWKTRVALPNCSSYTMTSYSNYVYTIQFEDDKVFTYNYSTGEVVVYYNGATLVIKNASIDTASKIVSTLSGYSDLETKYKDFYSYKTGIKFYSDMYTLLYIALNGSFFNKKYSITSLTPAGEMTIDYNDSVYTFDLTAFDTATPALSVYATDVRTDTDKYIMKINPSSEKQILKQQWNTTTEIENYWWVDSTHILVLDKENLILKVRGDTVSNWDADNWTELEAFPRATYLPSNVTRYLCSNAYNGATAVFITFECLSDTQFSMTVYNPLQSMAVLYSVTFTTKHAAIGSSLIPDSPDTIAAYSKIIVGALLSEADISATVIDNMLLVGVHYDNNLMQWTFRVNLVQATLDKQLIGYGYVGIDGSLTGGELPAFVVTGDSSVSGYAGFNATVQSLENLDTEDKEVEATTDLQSFTTGVYGNETQQWYITKQITDGIVSHFTYDTDTCTWVSHIIPLSSNYTCVYDSPSFLTRLAGDLGIQSTALANLLPDGSFNSSSVQFIQNIIDKLSATVVYFVNPKVTTINYLQQTLGQYAYVHYNSTSNGKQNEQANQNNLDDVELGLSHDINGLTEDNYKGPLAVTSDELSFDIQRVPQKQKVAKNPWGEFFYMLGVTAISALDFTAQSVVVNTYQNQSAVSDIGKKYSQAFLKNLDSMSSTSFITQSITPTLKSEVTALKTLDMFYSTSAGQKVKAGPGFVNHNFVAQCIAQSVTSIQLESQQLGMMLPLKALTLWQTNLAVFATNTAAQLLEQQAAAQGGTPFTLIGMSSGTSYGWITSLVLATSWATLRATNAILLVGTQLMESILDALGAKQLNSNITANQSRHTYDIEGKHRYGSKSEVLMWPCYGATGLTINDEKVYATTQSKPWEIAMSPFISTKTSNSKYKYLLETSDATYTTYTVPDFNTILPTDTDQNILDECTGEIDYRIAACYGESEVKSLPDGMAAVIGTDTFLPSSPFKNENISESEPVFPVAPIQDYKVNDTWQISQTCVDGEVLWVSCKDTKLIDGAPSNMVISSDFCGIASSYAAIEVRNGLSQKYMRPWAITPNVLALNCTGYNVAYDEKMYHGFDGVGYRLISWLGASGINKEHTAYQYAFQRNDRFKRSNILRPNVFMGNFKSEPDMAVDSVDNVISQVVMPSDDNVGNVLVPNVAGEDRDVARYALPIFSEFVNTLPAAVKTLSTYRLAVIDGVTSLCTDIRNTQSAYKVSESIDFTIDTQIYRMTEEFICSVQQQNGVDVLQYLVPVLGMKFLGASPHEAYLYSQATRQYYVFTGGTNLRVVDMLERFRDITSGRWDFVNQEVAMPCLATFDRLDSNVSDDADETDNIIVPVFKNTTVSAEVAPPITTIFDTDSWFRTLSLPSGLTYQGPNRCIINRFVYTDYMLEGILANKGEWVKVPREEYHPFREYHATFKNVETLIDTDVDGWTHNPFLLVTAPLGASEDVDCVYEWEITFAWTVEMDKIYAANEYACVNIAAETMTPGGKLVDRPTHVFLTKKLFTNSGNYGYYSFRFQSKNGAGNRERLHIWSDNYIAVSGLQCEYKVVTAKRTEKLTQQVDIQGLVEM